MGFYNATADIGTKIDAYESRDDALTWQARNAKNKYNHLNWQYNQKLFFLLKKNELWSKYTHTHKKWC